MWCIIQIKIKHITTMKKDYQVFHFQDFTCPPECLCKGRAIYCSNTHVDIYNLPTNATLLIYTACDTSTIHNVSSRIYPNMGLLNLSNSRILLDDLRKFLRMVPNLRVLLIRNASLNDLGKQLFFDLKSLNILDIQENSIVSISSESFTGLKGVPLLDLHSLLIRSIHSKSLVGMDSLQMLNFSSNLLTYLPTDVFSSLRSIKDIDLRGNLITNIPVVTFDGLNITLHISNYQLCCFIKRPSLCVGNQKRYNEQLLTRCL